MMYFLTHVLLVLHSLFAFPLDVISRLSSVIMVHIGLFMFFTILYSVHLKQDVLLVCNFVYSDCQI